MGKRFRETNVSREAWFRKLSPVHKCAWNFLCDECDVAGIWSIDADAMAFYIGQDVDIDEFITKVNADKVRVERFGNDKIFIPGFVEFQYGELSEHCKPHQKIISLLDKYNLLQRVSHRVSGRVSNTLQEKEEDKDREEDREKDKDREDGNLKRNRRNQNRIKIDNVDPALKSEYDTLIEEVNAGKDLKISWIKIKEFIEKHSPKFPEPYVDIWNIFASTKNLTRIAVITPGRRDKFRTRISEPQFEFIKILDAIQKNDFYLGKGSSDWKVDFDFIINSQDNYIKIIERKAS
jgi:hypothetical protein